MSMAAYIKQQNLGDHVFLDENDNGQQDAGEDDVAGVTVNLLDEDGNSC